MCLAIPLHAIVLLIFCSSCFSQLTEGDSHKDQFNMATLILTDKAIVNPHLFYYLRYVLLPQEFPAEIPRSFSKRVLAVVADLTPASRSCNIISY